MKCKINNQNIMKKIVYYKNIKIKNNIKLSDYRLYNLYNYNK